MNGSSDDLEVLFRRISGMKRSCIDAECVRRGIHLVGHPAILFFLRHCTAGMAASQKEIADALHMSTPTVAIQIKRMEKEGLVLKAADETDLRRNMITLSEKGRILADEAHDVFDYVEKNMFNNLTAEECLQLKKLFLRIVANLEHLKSGQHPPNKTT
jgi:DNA-binding MarR family transcriptional regulator